MAHELVETQAGQQWEEQKNAGDPGVQLASWDEEGLLAIGDQGWVGLRVAEIDIGVGRASSAGRIEKGGMPPVRQWERRRLTRLRRVP